MIRDPRKFCLKCDREMLLRKSAKPPGAGNQFWDRSTYPVRRFMLLM